MAMALTIVLIGGATALRVYQSCGDFNIKLRLGEIVCKPAASMPVAPKAAPTEVLTGFVYYGRKASGQPSDRGQLMLASSGTVPDPRTIARGDVLEGLAVKELRDRGVDDGRLIQAVPAQSCFRVLRKDRVRPFKGGEGVWLQVVIVPCSEVSR